MVPDGHGSDVVPAWAQDLIDQLHTVLIHATVTELQVDFAGLQTDFAGLRADLAELRTNVAGLNNQVRSIDSRVSTPHS